MKITQLIVVNDHGEDEFYTVGLRGVKSITEHPAQGEGDKWFYDVEKEEKVIRVFNFKEVVFDK